MVEIQAQSSLVSTENALVMSSVSLILPMVRLFSAYGTLDKILKKYNCKDKGMVSENTRLWPSMNKNVYEGHHGWTV